MKALTLHLHGDLQDKFGGPYKFFVPSPAAALRLLDVNFKGQVFRHIRGGMYSVLRGRDINRAVSLDEKAVTAGVGGDDVHVIPQIAGASVNKGTLAIIAGTVLIGAAFVASGGLAAGGLVAGFTAMQGTLYGTAASIGLALAVGGAVSLLSTVQQNQNQGSSQDSGLFNTPANTMQSGLPVPVVYGRFNAQPLCISAGIHVVGSVEGQGPWSNNR